MELNEKQVLFLENKLLQLNRSKFRSSFKLREKEKKIISDKGMDVIYSHAMELIHKRLSPSVIMNDGKQTPMRGHPVFVAQHATATCCRGCLKKWHNIDMNRELTTREEKFIVSLIVFWIEKNYY